MVQASLTSLFVLPFSPVIRAKVVGKKLLKEGPFGTMVYTIKQMKVSDSPIPGSGGFGGGQRARFLSESLGQWRQLELDLESVFAWYLIPSHSPSTWQERV